MDSGQLNYTTTQKELLAIVFVPDKFCSHLLGSKIVVFSDHAALRFLLKKPDAKPRLIRDQVIHRCIPNIKINLVIQFCRVAPGGGHYGSTGTGRKVLDCGLYWPTIFRDVYQFVSTCDKCQKAGMAITKRHEMPQQPILFCKVFDVSGIDFMGPFLVSNDYVSRWVEATATKINDAKVVVDFLKSNIFCPFSVPKVLISDQDNHFCNRVMSSLLHKYGVTYQTAITYNPMAKLKFSTGK
ncbi:putative mitochondrial protein, partial [Mucuna pruriens]